MIGILLVTHGEMASGMINAMSLIMGDPEGCQFLGLFHGDDITQFKDKIKVAVEELDEGEGVIVLTDLFSASPYNQTAMSLNELKDHRLRLVSGVNLPMLIEAFNQRLIGSDLEATYKAVLNTGKDGIKEFLEEVEKFKQ